MDVLIIWYFNGWEMFKPNIKESNHWLIYLLLYFRVEVVVNQEECFPNQDLRTDTPRPHVGVDRAVPGQCQVEYLL